MRSPIAKLAIAAALIAGIFVLASHLTGRESTIHEPEPRRVEHTPTISPPLQQESLQSELALARTLYAQRAVGELVSLLQKGRSETRMKVAEYLGQIGDRAALPALQSLASRWQGAPNVNPYQKAIDAIERHEPAPPGSDRREPGPPSPTQTEGVKTDAAATVPKQPSEPLSADTEVVTYEGRVVDETGAAVASVHVWGLALSRTFRTSVLAQETTTDAGGGFRLAAARPVEGQKAFNILFFDHLDYGTGWRVLGPTSERVQRLQITLFEPAAVMGTVTDNLGRPIAGALVEAEVRLSVDGRTDQLMLWDLMDMAMRTDEKGCFALNRLPAPASLRLRVSAVGYALYTTPRGPRSAFPIQAGDEGLRIALEPGGSIAGRIVRNDGKPYEQHALIVIEGPGVQELIFATDDDGRFTSPGLAPGLYHLCAFKEDFRPLCEPVDAHVDLGRDAPEVVLTALAEGLPVTVQIVDETTGAPLEGVWVRAEFAETGEGSVTDAKTDAAGQCFLAVPPGHYRIVAQGWKNGQFAPFSEDVVVAPKQTDITVVMAVSARTRIVGQLINADGEPATGFVEIGSGNRTETDPNGRFSVEEPFSDTFEYRASWAYDSAGQTGKMFLFRKADYTDDLLIMLEPCVTLTGRIIDEAGSVQSDAKPKLGISTPGGGTTYYSRFPWKVTGTEEGVFIIENVPVGVALRVSAEWKGMQAGTQVDGLVPGQTHDVGDLVLRGYGGIDATTDWTGTLEGTITDEKLQPVSGVTVKAYTGNDRFEAVTDRRGRYRLSKLPKGVRLNFSLYLPGYGHCHKYVYADSEDGDMQIFPQGWELLGQQAPPLSIAKWFNSPPLTLEALRGKVVLLQIGVLLPLYGRDLTTMQKMHEKYAGQGLELIAVHQPLDVTWGGKVTEEDIQKFLTQDNVPFAFCLDNKRETYRAYGPKATPALYLIDRGGQVVISPTTENLEEWIRELLAR